MLGIQRHVFDIDSGQAFWSQVDSELKLIYEEPPKQNIEK